MEKLLAELVISLDPLLSNVQSVLKLVQSQNRTLVPVTKMFLSDPRILEPLFDLGVRDVADNGLAQVRKTQLKFRRHLLKVDPRRQVPPKSVDFAYSSLLDQMRGEQPVWYLQVEAGDFRDGIPLEILQRSLDSIPRFSRKALRGLAANLGCLAGRLADELLIQRLASFRALIAQANGGQAPLVSLGGTVVFEELEQGGLPDWIQEIRLGEALWFGYNTSKGRPLESLQQGAWVIRTQVLETYPKDREPWGLLGRNAYGQPVQADPLLQTSQRAVLDIGAMTMPLSTFAGMLPGIHPIAASHDHLVIGLDPEHPPLKPGQFLEFPANYTIAALAFQNPYIRKLFRKLEVTL